MRKIKKIKSSIKRLFIITLILTLLPSLLPIETSAQVKTIDYRRENLIVKLPNWNEINFGNLPALDEGGEIKIPLQYVQMLGYNPNRVWKSGDRVADVVMLGDVSSAFGLERFNLNSLSQLTNTSLSSLRLKDVKLIKLQTPKSLAKAIPALRSMRIDRIRVLKDFFKKVNLERYLDWNVERYLDGEITLEDAIALLPDKIVNQTLGEVLNLQKYNIDSIPGLMTTAMGKLLGWQQSTISDIPLLNKIPFAKFPIPIPIPTNLAVVAIADVMWGESEHGDPFISDGMFVSGSAKNGKNKPIKCVAYKPCPYIELSGLNGSIDPSYGKRWVVGKYQLVPGGEGILGGILGGKEPTGRLVFSTAFKMILMNTNEEKGTATFGINLRICKRGLIDLGCSPYMIGTIPLFTVREKDLVFLGIH